MTRHATYLVALVTIAPAGMAAQPTARSEAVAPADTTRSKSRPPYHLFRPTPWALARELSTDRPDKTESPFTVPAGRIQVELDLVTYTRDLSGTGSNRTRFETLALAPVNLKVGLLPSVDVQLVLETYVHTRQRFLAGNLNSTASRFGAVTGRVKVNAWGNDGGKTALGFMPFVSFVPNDAGGRDANGGLIVPVAVDLGRGFGLGGMAEFDLERGEVTGKHHVVFVHSVTVGHEWGAGVGSYAELFSAISTEPGARWVGTFDLGVTRALGPKAQLDFGVNLGVSRAADDFNPFLGLSFRF